jgi:putative nucleotidyltransferase with HDIG domain
LSLAVIGPAKLLLYASATSRLLPATLVAPLLPLGLAPLLGSILIGGPAAAVIGIWTTLCVSIFYGHSFPVLILGLVVTVVAAGSAGEVRRRSRVFRMGLFMGLAAVAVVLCFGALNQQTAHVLSMQVLNALLSGLLASLLAVVLIPVFEWLFNLTTDITLLELSDMGHPVLQRLAIEAPGTYHHSLMVSNLAASAASTVGANPLLARVSAYFHDIGKLTKPEFFAENIQFSQNPHDDLSPSMSALVIISHVKEGIALAQRHNLPKPILDGIEQHHGTSLIFYFYHRALKQAEADPDSSRAVTEDAFRYPGPRPRTREMGILLLADSVEAASRSMEKPTAAKIATLVDDIVDGRLRDGQLDQCNLTFAHLSAIKESFVFTLTNMLHGRVAYPKHEDRDQQQTKQPSAQFNEAEALQPVAHGTD